MHILLDFFKEHKQPPSPNTYAYVISPSLILQGGAKVGLQLWVSETRNLFLYYYLLIIVLFSLWTTVNLLCPTLYMYSKGNFSFSVYQDLSFSFVFCFIYHTDVFSVSPSKLTLCISLCSVYLRNRKSIFFSEYINWKSPRFVFHCLLSPWTSLSVFAHGQFTDSWWEISIWDQVSSERLVIQKWKSSRFSLITLLLFKRFVA